MLWRVIPARAQANIITAITAAFLLCDIIGTFICGFSVAFYIAPALVPVMLTPIIALALSNPPLSSTD